MRRTVCTIIAILVMGLLIGHGIPAEAQQVKVWKIGAIFPITGPGATFGEAGRNSALMFQEEINKAGGINGVPIEVIIADDQSNESKAVLAANKLINNDGVVAIIGSYLTGPVMAILPVMQKSQIPLIALSGSSPPVEPIRKWIFKTPYTDRKAAERYLMDMKKRGVTKLAILSVSNALGDSVSKHFKEQGPEMGIKIVAHERFEQKDTDMSVQLTKIRATDAQAVIGAVVGPPAAIIAKNVQQLGMKIPLYLWYGVGDQVFLDMAGDAANGIRLAVSKYIAPEQLPDSDPLKSSILSVKKEYEKKYGTKTSNMHVGGARDALSIIVQAIRQGGKDPASIRDQMVKIRNLKGIWGFYNITEEDHVGLDPKDLMMVEVRNKKWVIY
ncbi:MAG: ABC transporter substrate-binding protein [Thermodesulfobacteriota bacterium]